MVRTFFATINGAAVEVDEVAPELEKEVVDGDVAVQGHRRRDTVVAAMEHPIASNASLIG